MFKIYKVGICRKTRLVQLCFVVFNCCICTKVYHFHFMINFADIFRYPYYLWEMSPLLIYDYFR